MTVRRHGDRGAAAVELAVLLPVFILFFGLVTFWGRRSESEATATSAARWAARTLSLARDPAAAVADAEADALETVQAGRAACQTMEFAPDITDDTVTVSITCTLQAADLLLLPVPGTSTITVTATEPRDRYREDAP